MSKNDLFNDMSIDSILNDVKQLTGEQTVPERLWSLDEIDALLADDTVENKESNDTPVDNGTETSDKAQEKVEPVEEKAPMQEEKTVDKAKENRKIEKTSTLGLKEFAMKNSIETGAIKTRIENENTESLLKEFEEKEPEIEPLISSAEENEAPSIDEETVENEESKAEKEIPGQISIEKTRVFNEVEARAVRNENINHHIGENKIIRTGSAAKKGGMETDPYRERFLNKPTLDIEKTQDHRDLLKDLPAKTIEKHGVVVKKSSLEKTSTNGLSPIPILVDASDEYDAQQRLEMEAQSGTLKSNAFPEDENQIVLDGFNEQEEINIVNEAEEEEKLRKIRRDKASKFRLFPNIEVDDDDVYSDTSEQKDEENYDNEKTKAVVLPEEKAADSEEAEISDIEEAPVKEKRKKRNQRTVSVAREFFGPKDAKAVYEIYMKERSYGKRKIIVCSLALALLFACSAITSFLGSFALFSDSPFVYSVGNLIVLVAVGAVNYKSIADCIENLKEKRFNKNTALTASLLTGIIQCVVSLGFGDLVLSGTHIYSAVALFPVLLINIGDYITTNNDIDNFILINREQKNAYAVKKIDDDGIAFEVGRGLMIKDPDIRYCAKVNFPYKFVEMSRAVDPTADSFNIIVPAALAAGIIVGIISAVINKNAFVGVTSFTGVFLMAMPAASVVACASALRGVNKKLNAENGLISGYEAVEDTLDANAAVLDARDIFSGGDANVYGIKMFNSMRIDEAILYTAAVVIQSEGALSDVFDSIILSKREMLPNVESLAYEERLGCSGWIYNYRVLVGNRDLLVKHNVEVQSKEEESVFTRSGRQVVYLAVEGKVAAMFVVGYSADEQTAVYMRELERAGVSILVRTTDSNISEELVEQYFGLPRNFIKVISPVAGLMYKEMSEKQAVNEPCRVLHNGSVNSFLHSFTSALKLQERRRIINILQYIGVGISVILMAMFSFLSGLSQAGAVQILLFETLWTLVVAFAPKIKKI
ncbi:MAG: hypothetical protein PUA67_00755 [Ruminococcus sp.]|nr:hypothetical protein [Ruminococcus sp.]